jgi:predicted DNA-binding ArsR family transcriptional regulator
MMEQKLSNLIKAAHEVVDANDKDTSMLLFTAHTKVSANVCGNQQKLAQMLYSVAKSNEDIADIIITVANTLQEDDEK